MEHDLIKRELIRKYLYLIVLFCLIFACFYLSINLNKFIICYIAAGLFCIFYSILITSRNYNVETAVHCWLILAPLYISPYFIIFWHYSFISYMWILPIPFVVYIFFSVRMMIRYTIGLFLYVIIIIVLAEKINYQEVYMTRKQLLTSDILVVICNISVFVLLLYYLDKLKTPLFFPAEKQNKDRDRIINKSLQKDLEKYKDLFNDISVFMETNKPFKNSDLTISNLATQINSNNTYISKAIKLKGYANFNNYLNSYRIKYVKELMKEEKSKHFTLVYIYTEAGFTSQSTFNRVFKQFEGISPAKYMKLNIKEEDE
ncbi:Helix-turn-helix domain-containing protein [Chryseobacterium sp. OV279]|nr:Helix-turn-helix domain-containing protein [Chryseobacterium sp. OV279]